MTTLSVDHVTYLYPSSAVAALDDVSLTVEAGDVLGVLGHNGAGKTTLLLLVAGLLTPSIGTVTIDGTPAQDRSLLSRVGVLTEKLSFFPRYTVEETCRIFARLHRCSDEAATVAVAIDRLNLSSHRHVRVRELSSGLRKRLALAIAVMHEPDVILLDEPFAGIDPESVELILGLIQHWSSNGRLVILASHDLAEVEAIASHLAIIRYGEVLASGTVAELRQQVLRRIVQAKTSSGIIEAPAHTSALASAFDQHGPAEVLELNLVGGSLADLYRHLHATPTAADEHALT